MENSVFVLDMQSPTLTLHLSKTILPFTPPSSTYAFCVITSQAQRYSTLSIPLEDQSPGIQSSISTDLRSSLSSSRASASTGQRTSISNGPGSTGSRSESTDGYFPNPNTSKRTKFKLRMEKPPAVAPNMSAVAEEYWALFDSVDWSKTKLGHQDNWLDVIGPMMSVIFQSKTQDCIWLGEDLHQI